MLEILRNARLLAPALLGTVLTVGCQTSGSGTASVTPPGTFAKPAPTEQKQTPAFADNRRTNPDVQGLQDRSTDESEDPWLRSAQNDSTRKEASTVELIPSGTPGAHDAKLTPTVPPGVPARADLTQRTATAPQERIEKLSQSALVRVESGVDPTPDARLQLIEQREQALIKSSADVKTALAELDRQRASLDSQRKEVEDMHAEMRRRVKEDIETQKMLIEIAKRALGEGEKQPDSTKPTDK